MTFYRALLLLYPASFRGEYGDELTRLFATRMRDASNPLSRVLLWFETIVDVLLTAFQTHWDILRQGVRYTLRTLRRSPGFTVTAIGVAALGVGATTAAYTITDYILIRQPEWQQERLVTILFGAFSVLALALSAVGLYSVVSYSVAQRTPEFGIRMALGARQRDVLRDVFASMAISVGSGVASGVLLTLILSTVLAQWVEGGSRDPLILVAVILVLIAASMSACFIPAHRASSIDPMSALRYD